MGKYSTFHHLCRSAILLAALTIPIEFSNAKDSSPSSSKKVEAKQDVKQTVQSFMSLLKNSLQKNDRKPAGVVPVPPPPAGSCSVPFNEKVQAVKVQNHHIYVDLNQLNFLKSEFGFWLQDVELEVTYKDKHKQQDTLTLALNGIKASLPGGYSKNLTSLFNSKGQSCHRFKLHHLLMNGIEPFDHLLLRLKKNKGLLKITVLGRHTQIVDASVTFKGQAFVACSPSSTTTTTTTTLPQSSTTTTTLPNSPSTTTTTLPNSPSTTTTTLPNSPSTTTTTIPGSPVTTTTLPAPTTTSTTTTTTTTTTLPPEDLSKYQVSVDSVNPAQSPTASTNMLISFSSEFTDGTYWCSLDQAAFDKCQSPVSFAGLGNGDHSFQVYAQTPRGVVAGEATVYSWNVDSVPPTVQITNLADLPSLTNQVSITFQFVSSKAGTFKCSLDGSAAATCTSPVTYAVPSEGLHTFSVVAIDKVGNVSGSPAQYQWTIDLTPPVASIASIQPNEDLSRNPDRTLALASNETSNFECSIDHGGFSACESPVQLMSLSEGAHTFEVRAIDLAGNVGSVASASWSQDYTAPEVSIGNISPAVGLTNAGQASVEFFMNEPGQAVCLWDSQDAVPCSSPFTAAFDGDGSHQLSIYAVDTVGNSSAKITLNWMVDQTSPMISFGSILPSATTYLNSTGLSAPLNFSESMTWTASLNGSALSSSQNPIELSGLADGSYTLTVSGFDAAGNLSNTIEHSFIVDTVAPHINWSADGGSLINRDLRSYQFSSNETATYECSLDEAGFEACQSPRSYAGLADGDHTWIIRATDLAGNQSQVSDRFSVDTVAPSTKEAHNQIGNGITFSLSSSESGSSFLCSMDGQAFAVCSSPVSYTGLATGSHIFVAKSVDTAGNVDAVGVSYSFTVYPPVQTSITGSSPSASLVNSKSMSISFAANQPVSGYVCSRDGSAFTSCTSPVSYSGLADGAHSFVVKAIDLAGNTESTGASKSWTVDTTPPTVTSFTTTATTNTITVTWFLSESATGKVTYGVGTNLNQATVETSTTASSYSIKLSGLSSNTSYSIQVSGRDAAGNAYTSTVFTARTSR